MIHVENMTTTQLENLKENLIISYQKHNDYIVFKAQYKYPYIVLHTMLSNKYKIENLINNVQTVIEFRETGIYIKYI